MHKDSASFLWQAIRLPLIFEEITKILCKRFHLWYLDINNVFMKIKGYLSFNVMWQKSIGRIRCSKYEHKIWFLFSRLYNNNFDCCAYTHIVIFNVSLLSLKSFISSITIYIFYLKKYVGINSITSYSCCVNIIHFDGSKYTDNFLDSIVSLSVKVSVHVHVTSYGTYLRRYVLRYHMLLTRKIESIWSAYSFATYAFLQ